MAMRVTKEEIEYNKRPSLEEMRNIKAYEDKKMEEMFNKLLSIEGKVNKLISMLTAHDYDCKKNR